MSNATLDIPEQPEPSPARVAGPGAKASRSSAVTRSQRVECDPECAEACRRDRVAGRRQPEPGRDGVDDRELQRSIREIVTTVI